MGAWGYGILQNDAAQDSACDVARQVERDIEGLSGGGGADEAAKVGAATGLLLQFSQYSFNPENPFYDKLLSALAANRDFFAQLPGNSGEVLNAVMDGRGSDLATRDGEVVADIDRALHSDENEGFVMQKAFSVCELDLFRHPAAASYLQDLVDKIVAEVDEGFANDETVCDLSRESDFMGAFGLLLILPKTSIGPATFHRWRDRFREAWQDAEPLDDEMEQKFEEEYSRYLELAFQCGAARYATG